MPDSQNPDDLADLVAKTLSKVGGTVFTTPTSSSAPKPSSASARFVREIGPGSALPLKQPLSLACTPDGSLLVLDKPEAEQFRLTRWNADGTCAGALGTIARGTAEGALMEPVALLLDAEQQWYLVDAHQGCIKKYTPEGQWLDTFLSAGPTGKLFNNPLDAALDEAGNLLVADTNNNRIVQLQPDGELGWILETFPAPGGGENDEFYEPCSVCVGRGGVVRVADRIENRVLGFDAKRKLVGLWGDLPHPACVRMAADGTSVLVAARNRIARFAPSGAPAGSIEFPVDLGNGATADGGGALAMDARGNLFAIDPVRESILVFQF